MPRHSNLRASDADRDDVVERLREAAAEGRLSAEELDERVSRALNALTYGELAATVSDLPNPRRPAPGARPRSGGSSRAVAHRRTVGAWAVSTVRANPATLLLMIPLAVVTGAMLIAVASVWLVMLAVLSLVGMRATRRASAPWTLRWDGGAGRR